MKTITLEEAKTIDFKNLSIALGTFDGLHIGHMALVNVAKSFGGESAVMTFDTLPVDVFQAGHKPMRLFTIEEKIEAFGKTGIDYFCIVHFDKAFAHIAPHAFETLLHDAFAPKNVVAGYNFKYGNKAAGTVESLTESDSAQGYHTEVVAPVIVDGKPVSSTRIRECIWTGDVENAALLLGYPYAMTGDVIRGKGFGRQMGFPTANISVDHKKIIPKNGVYGVRVHIGYRVHAGVCNVGVNPTVSQGSLETSIEVNILYFDEDLYGQEIKVEFIRRIRDEIHFESVEQLKAQIGRDVQKVKTT